MMPNLAMPPGFKCEGEALIPSDDMEVGTRAKTSAIRDMKHKTRLLYGLWLIDSDRACMPSVGTKL